MEGLETVKCEYCPLIMRWRIGNPRKEGKYLVATTSEQVTTARYFEGSKYWKQYVVAWMPLPEIPEEMYSNEC